MKKHLKKIALILGVLVLCVAGYVFYTFQVKEYDTADEKVDEVTKEKIEIDLPDDSKLTVDEDGNVTEEKADKKDKEKKESNTDSDSDASGTASSTEGSATAVASSTNDSSNTVSKTSNSNGSTGNNGSSNNGSGGNSDSNSNGSAVNTGSNGNGSTGNGSNGNGNGSNGNNDTNGNGNGGSVDRVTVADIKQKYVPALEGLEATANARLNSLIGVAVTDYNKNSSKGYGFFYNKYTGAAASLEAQMDSAFYGVVDVMKRDLKANGLAESHVKSVVNEYENTKKQRKNDLMKKAAGLK
ncbi:hypothetical protein QWY14_07950 [Planococcus sp. N028]|uniref:Uncharacterized protein n=1 Tax=Planococcus shixiaomingii TaxID=3058393 RepID=A0ABT8N1F5_9BACL|nr:hypothetical protein [Planococcus sp. N028]MDN7241723.1 hypothetical protein [Planococcus sp. N028]